MPTEGVTALRVSQKQNNSSRQQTGMNKVQTWDSLQQAVDRLRMDADKELLDASPAVGSDDGLSGAAAPANGSTDGSGAGSWKDNAQSISQAPEEYGGDPREKVVEYDSTWRFWNTGLGSTGIMKLVVADAALELALFKVSSPTQA